MSTPTFAIVGHPNKGKSSLVATLARDASVRIGPEPGTTVHAREFPMRTGGKVLYTLVDTPGFQRARAALDWLKQHDTSAGSRADIVAQFVQTHEHEDRFRNECELLRPVVAGAGLIYVVDGATPYGPEYDAEMEILRWTGQPSLAVINPIGEPRFVEPWRRALEQFFRVVRVLDVMKAPFDQQLELLRAFGQLRETWRQPLEEAVTALIEHRERQSADAARVIVDMIAEAPGNKRSRSGRGPDAPCRVLGIQLPATAPRDRSPGAAGRRNAVWFRRTRPGGNRHDPAGNGSAFEGELAHLWLEETRPRRGERNGRRHRGRRSR